MAVTPLETCLLWYVWFWVDSDGRRPLYQCNFGHLLVNLDSYEVCFCRVFVQVPDQFDALFKNASEKNAENITPPSIGQLQKRTSSRDIDAV